jgi:hypothetical protein
MTKTCPVCKAPFLPLYPKQATCSAKCWVIRDGLVASQIEDNLSRRAREAGYDNGRRS